MSDGHRRKSKVKNKKSKWEGEKRDVHCDVFENKGVTRQLSGIGRMGVWAYCRMEGRVIATFIRAALLP